MRPLPQGSSLGDYSKPWINVFWRSVKGEEPRRFLRAALDSKEYPEGIKVVFRAWPLLTLLLQVRPR